MNLRMIIVVVFVLLVIAVPNMMMGPAVCGSLDSSLLASLQAQRSSAPSTGCSSDGPSPSFMGNCFACGATLLSTEPFLPKEGIGSSWHPVAPLVLSSLPSTYWHPPA